MSYSFLKMPDGVVLNEATATDTYGEYSLKPLERGYGVTLGNSLRRVLLSSLTGAAITAIKVDGVLHEFTSVPGVVEDVTDLILNLKKVRMLIENNNSNKVEINLVGPGTFTAEDIQKHSADIKILNPDLHIATLSDKAKLNIEVYYGMGKGYVPSTNQKINGQTIGLIPIDSIFTPVLKVHYDVQNVRIGESNEFEELKIQITTDGSITPEDALSNSAKILNDHLKLFVNFDNEEVEEKVESKMDAEFERLRKILITGVDDLELSVRSHNCLKSANIKTLGDLVRKDESELLKFRNFGRKSLSELMEIVENYGLDFGMDVDKYINDKSDSN